MQGNKKTERRLNKVLEVSGKADRIVGRRRKKGVHTQQNKLAAAEGGRWLSAFVTM